MHSNCIDCLVGRNTSRIILKESVGWLFWGKYIWTLLWGSEVNCLLSDFLAKNETLALPAESKTPEVEKIPALPITGNEIPMFINFEKLYTYIFCHNNLHWDWFSIMSSDYINITWICARKFRKYRKLWIMVKSIANITP